jgi:hypothetical protein
MKQCAVSIYIKTNEMYFPIMSYKMSTYFLRGEVSTLGSMSHMLGIINKDFFTQEFVHWKSGDE